ncbi:MAG TPA: PqqD family peptide modification chaperone [Geminicoccaceae bacterium]
MVAVPSRNQLLILNQSARCLFEALSAGAAPEDLAAILVGRYGIDEGHAARDVAATLAQWASAGALEGGRRPAAVPPAPAPPDRPARFSEVYAFGGHPVRVEVDDPVLAAPLGRLLGPLQAPDHAAPVEVPAVRAVQVPDGSFAIRLGRGEIRRAPDHDLALGEIINALIDHFHPGVRWLAIIHASAVLAAGGAVVMAAPSGSGKSTLCAALTQSGHRYMSDDVVPLAADGLAYPMPLAQSLKRGSWHVLAGRVPGLPDPDDRAPGRETEHYRAVDPAMIAGRPAEIAAFVVPRYAPGAALQHRELDPFSTFTHLIRARSWASLQRDDLERLLGVIHKTSRFELVYGSLDEAIAFLGRLRAG